MAKNTSSARVEAKPQTVAERRQALRAKEGAGPGLKKVEIDLTDPGARKQLVALYPRPENEVYIAATPALERAALDYIEERAQAKVHGDRKEVAGNVLCHAIGKNKGIRGKGWKADWDMSKGNVDWTKLVKDLNISDETVAKYRKAESRGLDVTEVDDGS